MEAQRGHEGQVDKYIFISLTDEATKCSKDMQKKEPLNILILNKILPKKSEIT